MKTITQKLILLVFLFATVQSYAQKVAIIGMNHVGTDGFTFLVTEDLASGEVIYFTENEYNDPTNAFTDQLEAVVIFTATSAIAKGNVVFINETATDVFSVTCTTGSGTAVKTAASLNFALATDGEALYGYTDSDSNPTNGITTIYSVMYTGTTEPGPIPSNGGNLPTNWNPINDFPNAIVIQGFPAVQPNRVEFFQTTPARTNITKAGLTNVSNYNHAVANQALSTLFFTNFNLTGANPTLTLTASPNSVNENSGSGMVFTFTLSANATSNVTVNFSVGGTATFSSDYTRTGGSTFGASSGTVTIPSGSNSASFTLTPVGESTLEPNETIIITAIAGTGYTAGSPSAATTTIINDDATVITPIVAVTGINQSTTQDGFSFVALQNISPSTVIYFTENPFDKSTLAFSGAEGVVQWSAPAGGITRGQVVVVTETSANTFTTTCSSGACGTTVLSSGEFSLASTGEELYAYLDTDANHVNGITNVQAILYTGSSAVSGGTIPTNQNPGLVYTGAVIVDGFPASSPLRTEYNPTSRGATVDRANFQNQANWIKGQSNITLSTVAFSNIIISTGVSNPFASVNVSPTNVAENSGSSMVFTFTLSSPAVGNVTINFSVGGTATFNTDYTSSGASSFLASSGSVVILSGTTSRSVTVTPIGDTSLEIQESIVLTLTSGTGYDGGSPNTATALINNDDTSSSQPLVVITGISHLDPDGFSFVAAQDIPAGSIVYFTDRSFNKNTLLFGPNECVVRWTSPGSTISKGTVVVITETSQDVFSVTCSSGSCGTFSLLSGNVAFATTGESLYAYKDTDTDPSNGVTEIYSVLFTGTSTVSGGNIPSLEDPSSIFLKSLLVQGFPSTAPARTEYNPASRNVLVTAAIFENISNWIHAQTPPSLSTVAFTNLNIIDNTPPTALCKNISVTPNVGSGSVTITASQIDNGSNDNVGIASYAINFNTFTCANVGSPVGVILTITDLSGNTATCNATVTVLTNVTSSFNPIAPICTNGNFTLPTTSTNGFTGTWSPAKNVTTTTTYTFTPNAGQCGGPTTMTVVVNPIVTPTFSAIAAICSGQSLSPLPTVSNNSVSGTWAPALNNTSTTTYTFTPSAAQCANTTTLTITVHPSVSVTLSTVSSICVGANSFSLPYTASAGSPSTYTISGTGITSVTNGVLTASPITVNLSSPAVFGTNPSFTISFKNTGGCSSGNLNGSVVVNPVVINLVNPANNLSGTSVQKASETINASNKITSPANVLYQAGKAINLTQGFEANAVFKAEIAGCGS